MAFGRLFTAWMPATAVMVVALACANPAQALEVGGVKLDDAATVGGKPLVLNGAGLRSVVFIKVYVAGLYLSEKKSASADVQALPAPKRVSLHFQREVGSDEIGQKFIESLHKNSSAEETAKIQSQTTQFGQLFASIGKVKAGDVVTLDWIPGTGTVCTLNGKQLGESLPDAAFYNALLRIWLGDNPVQSDLKKAMLGEK